MPHHRQSGAREQAHAAQMRAPADSVTIEGDDEAAGPQFAKEDTVTTCRQEALRWVHRYAAGGAVLSALPLPLSTSAALAAMETHMTAFIGSIYADPMGGPTTAAAGGTYAVMGQGLKYVAMQAGVLRPGARLCGAVDDRRLDDRGARLRHRRPLRAKIPRSAVHRQGPLVPEFGLECPREGAHQGRLRVQ